MISEIVSVVSAGVNSLLNMVPEPGRLTIIPVSDYNKLTGAGNMYVAMFNPEHWQTQDTVQFDDTQAPGSVGPEKKFKSVGAKTLSFDLLIDGTGASGEKRDVLDDIALLQKTTGFNGAEHRSNMLYVIYGKLAFQGVLESMSIKYTLFKPDGTPLRATVSLSFGGDTPRLDGMLKFDLQSTDLTHRRMVKDHDRLDLLCHNIYRESRHYIEVAHANKLTTFRKLPVGTELYFPPVEK